MQSAFHSALYMAVLQRGVHKPWHVAGDVIAIRISKWLCFGETNRKVHQKSFISIKDFIKRCLYESTKVIVFSQKSEP